MIEQRSCSIKCYPTLHELLSCVCVSLVSTPLGSLVCALLTGICIVHSTTLNFRSPIASSLYLLSLYPLSPPSHQRHRILGCSPLYSSLLYFMFLFFLSLRFPTICMFFYYPSLHSSHRLYIFVCSWSILCFSLLFYHLYDVLFLSLSSLVCSIDVFQVNFGFSYGLFR